MANKPWSIINHAIKTFSKPIGKSQEVFQSEFSELKVMVDKVKLEDLKFLNPLLLDENDKRSVKYLDAFENENVSIGVFILSQGAKLPTHDHPCMYGILKVVKGVFKITSYSVVETDTSVEKKSDRFFYQYPLKVTKHPEVILNEKDSACVLTPTDKNIHEVECVSGPAAFLDILSPPYEEESPPAPRSCHYFEEIIGQEIRDNYVRLTQIPDPFF